MARSSSDSLSWLSESCSHSNKTWYFVLHRPAPSAEAADTQVPSFLDAEGVI